MARKNAVGNKFHFSYEPILPDTLYYYECECLDGFIGEHCDEVEEIFEWSTTAPPQLIELDVCARNPCSNNATCVQVFEVDGGSGSLSIQVVLIDNKNYYYQCELSRFQNSRSPKQQ